MIVSDILGIWNLFMTRRFIPVDTAVYAASYLKLPVQLNKNFQVWINCYIINIHRHITKSLLESYIDFNMDIPYPDSKIRGANMGPTWVLAAPGGPHVGPMNLAIWVGMESNIRILH